MSQPKQGVIVLTLVIVISVLIMMIALALAFSSVTANQNRIYQGASSVVSFNLNGCANEALAKLNNNNSYSGETLIIGSTTCVITISGTDPVRDINITATSADYTRAWHINVTIFPTFVVNTWQELTT